MNSFVLLVSSLVLLCACSMPPQTPEQLAAAAADKENCPEITGSRLRHCGPNAMRDSGVKAMDRETARSMIGKTYTGSSKDTVGGK